MRPLHRPSFYVLRLGALVALLAGVLTPLSALAAELRVAAASSTQDAMESLAREYERRTGVRVGTSYGSSAKLYHQILQGAPFDLFYSADDVFPAKLEEAGRGKWRRRYATGRLVLWIPNRPGLAPSGSAPWGLDPSDGLDVLRKAQVRKVAIANPRLAPYGMAAQQAIAAAGLTEAVSAKLVIGESAAQAAHFVSTGAAEAGLLPLSIALSPRLAGKGRHALVPETLYSVLHAEAMVIAHENPEAKAFLDFSLSPAGRVIWRQYGLEPDK
jgi:molybdate transport system substrate-binding protein